MSADESRNYTHAFIDKEYYTSDESIRQAIDTVLAKLKSNPPQFLAILPDGTSKSFNVYEEAIAFLSVNPNCKVFVK